MTTEYVVDTTETPFVTLHRRVHGEWRMPHSLCGLPITAAATIASDPRGYEQRFGPFRLCVLCELRGS